MSVSSIFSPGSSPASLAQLYAPASASDTSSLFALIGLSPAITPRSTAPSATSVSSQAQLLSQLQALQTSNPAEFQKVTADISTQLQAAAQKDGGSQGQALTSLAAKFQQASQTGSLTPLQGAIGQNGTAVQGHRHGGGHHHGGGAPAASTDTSSDTSNTASDSVFNAASLTGVTPTATSTATAALSSASSLAASAYQQFSGQGIGSAANSIISQVLNIDLGPSAATGAVSLSA